MTDVKFCGTTRPEDAALAGELGAGYVGVIFASSPRRLDAARAATVLDAAGTGVKRVGVFGQQSVGEIATAAAAARLHVVQLHADPTPELVRRVRAATGCAVWAAVRVVGAELPLGMSELAAASDAVLLDARVPGALGGTGVTLPWADLARSVRALLGRTPLVLAGGLTPQNVAGAIAALAPAVADVSSGVECSPGVKDPELMRAFAAAVRDAGGAPAQAPRARSL